MRSAKYLEADLNCYDFLGRLRARFAYFAEIISQETIFLKIGHVVGVFQELVVEIRHTSAVPPIKKRKSDPFFSEREASRFD